MINVGTIPEGFSFTDVYTFHVAELPSLLVARRSSADELIWDADGGFTDQWKDRSSVEGNVGDGYDFHIARRSFSVAGLPIFASGTAGGGGSGDATSIQGEPVPAPSTGVLSFDGTDLAWTPATGTGDVVGPASAADDRIATFDGTSGKLIRDGGKTIAQVEATAAAYADAAVLADSGWRVAVDWKFRDMTTQALANGAGTIDGKAVLGVNITSGADAFGIVNGSGLVIDPNNTSTDFWRTADSAPRLQINIADVVPGYLEGSTQLRIWVEQSAANMDATVEQGFWGLHSAYSSNNYARWSFNHVFESGSVRRNAQCLVGSAEQQQTITATDSVTMLDFSDGWITRYFSKTPTTVDTDPNSDVFLPATMNRRWTNRLTFGVAALTDLNAHYFGAVQSLKLSLGAGTGNTANSLVVTFKRLRIEYRL